MLLLLGLVSLVTLASVVLTVVSFDGLTTGDMDIPTEPKVDVLAHAGSTLCCQA
jgi:hypothetical protein